MSKTVVQPLWWLSEDVLRRFGAAVDESVQRWCADWGIATLPPVEVRALDAEQLTEALVVAEAVHGKAGGPWLVWPLGVDAALQQVGFGGGVDASTLAAELTARAAEALVESLRARLREGGARAASTAAVRGPASAGAAATLCIADRRIGILVPSSWLLAQNLLARPASPVLAAWSPAQALAKVQVTLTLELGDSELTVGELSALASDDVVLVSQTAHAPLALRVDHSDIRLPAFLGRNGTLRAAQIASTSQKTSS